MLAHKLITELKSLGFTGSAGDMFKKYLQDRFTLSNASINDLLKDGLNATDVNRALADLVVDAADGLTPAAATDPYFANVVLLMHMDGSNNGTTFTDVTGKTVNRTGNVATKTAVKKYGTASALFDGAGDYLSLNGEADFAFGTGDFTIELWLSLNNLSQEAWLYGTNPLVNGLYPAIKFSTSSGNVIRYNANGAYRITGSIALSSTVFTHIAVSRVSGVTRLFINGVKDGADYADTNNYINGASRPIIGVNPVTGNTDYLNGYIDELRVTKGVGRYSANFTPPDAAFLDA